MQNDLSNIWEDLMAKSLAGESSVEEENQLQEWIAQNPENDKAFENFKKVFTLSNDYYANLNSKIPGIDIDHEWEHFVDTIQGKKAKVVSIISNKEGSSMNWLRIAAVILLVVGSGFVVNYFLNRDNTIEHQTTGVVELITLPDGSVVTLNKDSYLSFEKEYGEEQRTVNLTGEAFFEVIPDQKKRFVIHTDKSQIEVLGTSFNVQTNQDNKLTEVVVATGVVQFSSNKSNHKVILKAGDVGILNEAANRRIFSAKNVDQNFLSWKTRKMVFDDDGLESVIKTINKVYNANISVNSANTEGCKVTVTFDQQSLDAVMNVLKTTLNLTYKTEGDKIEIVDTGC